MRIVVELYGLPRRRAGISEVPIDLDLQSVQLAELIEVLAEQYRPRGCPSSSRRPLMPWKLGTSEALQVAQEPPPAALQVA